MPSLTRTAATAGALLLVATLGHAQQPYVESFSSTAFRDAAETTAEWDTTAGTVGLRGPRVLGTYDTAGQALDVDVRGALAVVADGGAVRTIDVSNPAAPVQLGSVAVPAPGTAKAVAIHGTFAVVATGSTGILVVDLSDPTSPSILGSADTPGDACGVAMRGYFAYVADTTSLVIFGIVDPTNPLFFTSTGAPALPGTILDVEVEGDSGAIALGAAGFRKLSFNLQTPNIGIGPLVDTPGFVSDVEVAGDVVYVCDGAEGLKVFDALLAPVQIGGYTGAGSATDVELSGDRAFLLDSADGLTLLDVTDATAPALAATVPAAGGEDLVVADTRALVASGAAGLRVVETGVVAPSVVGGGSPLTAQDIAVQGDRIFSVQSNRVSLIDASDPANPQGQVVYTSPTWTYGLIDVAGDVGAVGTASFQRVQIFDFSNPTSPGAGSDVFIGGNPLTLEIDGQFAWVTTTNGRLERVDLVTAQTVNIATFSTPAWADVDGNRLYVTAENTLRVYDIGAPFSPVLIGSTAAQAAFLVQVSGNYAYVSRGPGGCWIYDVSDPAAAVQVGSIGGSVNDLDLDGRLLYVNDSANTRIFDVTDPTSPVQVGNVPTSNTGFALHADGNRLVAIDGWVTIFEPIRGLPDTVNNVAQSLSIDGEDELIDEVSLTSVQEPGVSFEVTADGGQNWQGVPSDGTWTALSHPGDDLRWRSTHDVVTPGENPTCSNLVIDWRNPPPTTFCEGAEVGCPCGNPGVGGAGCDLPQGTGGVLLSLVEQNAVANRATLQGTGFPSAGTPTSIVIRAESLETTGVVFGDGVRCVGTPVVRLAATFASGGTATHTFGHGAMAGAGTFYYQLWFRSTPAMFCTPDAFNLSNGRSLTW